MHAFEYCTQKLTRIWGNTIMLKQIAATANEVDLLVNRQLGGS
jgi:hypothetical protein